MKLCEITQNEGSPYEIKNAIALLPNQAETVIAKLRASDKLLFFGLPLETAIKKVDGYFKSQVRRGLVQFESGVTLPETIYYDDHMLDDFDFAATVKSAAACYIGYSKKINSLVIGYEVTLDEYDVRGSFSAAYKKTLPEEAMDDIEEHEENVMRDFKRAFGKSHMLITAKLIKSDDSDTDPEIDFDIVESEPGAWEPSSYMGMLQVVEL